METGGDLEGYLDEFVDLTDQFFVWLNDLTRPEPGSDFAVDAEHDQLPVSTYTRTVWGLSCAADHLMVLRRLMPDELETRFVAPFTLLRSVYEVACQTAWLIGPEEPEERITRLYQLFTLEVTNAKTALARMHAPFPGGDELVSSWAVGATDEVDRLKGMLKQRRGTAATPKILDTITGGQAIIDARSGMDPAFSGPTSSDGRDLDPLPVSIWRMHSGAAHSRMWIYDSLTKSDGPNDDGRIPLLGSLNQIGISMQVNLYVLKVLAEIVNDRVVKPNE